MVFEKISEEELSKVGVELLDDRPALPASEVKQKFEETAKKLLAPKFNALVDALQAFTAAASIGADAPNGLDGSTVQELLNALKAFVDEHLDDEDNPHKVTADQTGSYTKEETDQAINKKMVAIGSGDMAQVVYDPGHLGVDACVQRYTHTKSGNVHNFAGNGVNGVAKITAAFSSGDTVQLNGVPVTATCGADPVDGDTIVNGQWVAFVADAEGGQINFKGGGGLGNTKLGQATASPDYVSQNVTFYAGSKELKNGSLTERGTWQYAGGIGRGSGYVALNMIPTGIYRDGGTPDWAPEIRVNEDQIVNYIVDNFRSKVLARLNLTVTVTVRANLGTEISTPYANAEAQIQINGAYKGSVSARSRNMNGDAVTNSTNITVS